VDDVAVGVVVVGLRPTARGTSSRAVDAGDGTLALEAGDGDRPEVDDGDHLSPHEVPGIVVVGQSRGRPPDLGPEVDC